MIRRKKQMGKRFGAFLLVAFLAGVSPPATAQGVLPSKPGVARLVGLLEKGNASYGKLRDYRALFVKREKSGVGMGEEEKIFLKFEKPFKIFMKWMNTQKKGLQVLYERGRHRGKLLIHKPGILSHVAPVISLDQSSPWVRQGSASYHIEDAGIGAFLKDFTGAVLDARRKGCLKVKWTKKNVSDVTFLKTNKDSIYFAYRVRVGFDEITGLPIHMRLFDWNNRLMGIYEYRELKLNAGSDKEFEKEIDRHLLKIYSSP